MEIVTETKHVYYKENLKYFLFLNKQRFISDSHDVLGGHINGDVSFNQLGNLLMEFTLICSLGLEDTGKLALLLFESFRIELSSILHNITTSVNYNQIKYNHYLKLYSFYNNNDNIYLL